MADTMNNDNPKISVIMLFFNEINYIEDCLKSIINQAPEEIEIICVNGESSASTLEILEEYASKDSRIEVYTSNKKNRSHKVNLTLSKAKGEHIGIIETNNVIEENQFEQLCPLTKNSTVDLAKSTFYHYNDSYDANINNTKKNIRIMKKFTIKKESLIIEGHPSFWTGIYRREFLNENDIKIVEEDGCGGNDNLFFYESSIIAKSIHYIYKPYYYYLKSNQDSSSNNLTYFTLPIIRILDLFDIFKKYGCVSEEVKRVLHNRLFRYIEIILENMKFDYRNLDYDTIFYIQKVLNKVDDDFVREKIHNNFNILYHKFISPLFLRGLIRKIIN